MVPNVKSEWEALARIREIQAFMGRLGWMTVNGRSLGGFGEGGDLSAMSFVQAVLDRECVW